MIADVQRLEALARELEKGLAAYPQATFAEAVEAMALIACHKAGLEPIGSVDQAKWANSMTHLLTLSQGDRLWRDPLTGLPVRGTHEPA